ncbi:MAG TPA: DUF4345 family protein [Gemmatimonadales bacterium]|nr:DUF4345 family protein [Gemmatimonadales bacterium]
MTLPRAVVGFTAAAFIGFGIAFTFWPGPLAAVVDIGLPTATARVDLAATYGGFELGFGAFLLLALFRPAWTEAGLWAGMLALGGFAAVRLGSLVLSTAPVRSAIYLALGLEVIGMLLNLWGLSRLRS